MSNTNDGTVDLTNFVETMRSTFVLSTVAFLLTEVATVPYVGTTLVSIPLFRAILKKIFTWGADKVSKRAENLAFFMNTAIRKAWQSSDYIEAVKRKKALPEDVSDAVFEKAEKLEIQTFDNFVRLTN